MTKTILTLLTGAVIAGLVLLLVLVRAEILREPSQRLATAAGPRQRLTVETGMSTARVDVPIDKPVEMGLPVWTTVLPTMPTSLPPVDTRPPAVPAAALR